MIAMYVAISDSPVPGESVFSSSEGVAVVDAVVEAAVAVVVVGATVVVVDSATDDDVVVGVVYHTMLTIVLNDTKVLQN